MTTSGSDGARRWVTCQHCGHVWFLQTADYSRQCIACGRRDWLAPGDRWHTGPPRAKDRQERWHECKRCGYTWLSPRTLFGLPKRCTNRACGARTWQTG